MQMNEVMTLLTYVSGHALVKSFSGSDVTGQPFSIGRSHQTRGGRKISDQLLRWID